MSLNQTVTSADNTTQRVITGVQAVPCREFYAAEIEAEALEEEEGFFTQEYVNTKYQWICPNLTQIYLLNDYSTDVVQGGAIF